MGKEFSRRSALAFAVGAAVGCSPRTPAATEPAVTANVDAPRPERQASGVVLAWHNLSVFHGDGDRAAFRGDGYALYERMARDSLLRWEGTLDAAGIAQMLAVVDQFARGPVDVPTRSGVPDEVRILVHVRSAPPAPLVEFAVWERDLGVLPPGHPIHALRALVGTAGNTLTGRGAGVAKSPKDAGDRWPDVLPKS
jgi:hypothetical protein